MKKLFILLFTLLSINCFADQYTVQVARRLVEDFSNAGCTIEKAENRENSTVVVFDIPSYCMKDPTTAIVLMNSILQSYEDIYMATPWYKNENYNYISVFYCMEFLISAQVSGTGDVMVVYVTYK